MGGLQSDRVGGWAAVALTAPVHCLETARKPWGLSAGPQVWAKSPQSLVAVLRCVSWEPWLLDAGGVFVIKRG